MGKVDSLFCLKIYMLMKINHQIANPNNRHVINM